MNESIIWIHVFINSHNEFQNSLHYTHFIHEHLMIDEIKFVFYIIPVMSTISPNKWVEFVQVSWKFSIYVPEPAVKSEKMLLRTLQKPFNGSRLPQNFTATINPSARFIGMAKSPVSLNSWIVFTICFFNQICKIQNSCKVILHSALRFAC